MSDPRCPRCGKRLTHDIGQDDITGSGALIVAYRCDNCDYATEEMRRPWATRDAPSGGQTLAESLYRLRASL